MPYRVLPPAARLPVVGEVITDPLVDLAQRHLLLWRAVDGEGNEAGVAVRRLPVFMLLHLLLVQRGVGVQQGALLAHSRSVGVLGVRFPDGRLHGQLREPVHGGQATLELRSHFGWAGLGWGQRGAGRRGAEGSAVCRWSLATRAAAQVRNNKCRQVERGQGPVSSRHQQSIFIWKISG